MWHYSMLGAVCHQTHSEHIFEVTEEQWLAAAQRGFKAGMKIVPQASIELQSIRNGEFQRVEEPLPGYAVSGGVVEEKVAQVKWEWEEIRPDDLVSMALFSDLLSRPTGQGAWYI